MRSASAAFPTPRGPWSSSACESLPLRAMQRIQDRLVPGVHQRSDRLRSSALRVSLSEAVASITRTRAGSALARAR